MIDERALNIYTDGSSRPKPRRGGIGIRYIWVDDAGKEVVEDLSLPGYQGATNNEMELNACVMALRNSYCYFRERHYSKIIIFSDSNYVITNINNAKFYWPQSGWLKRSGAPVLNAALWKELIKEIQKIKLRVEFQKVKGHSKDIHNKAVDKLAKDSAQGKLNPPISNKIVRRKKSDEKTCIGSVLMLGQKIMIRIIDGQYLRVQKIYRYRYEVVAPKSPYYRKVDFACSNLVFREAHTYSVRMNSLQDNPQIVRCYKEKIKK